MTQGAYSKLWCHFYNCHDDCNVFIAQVSLSQAILVTHFNCATQFRRKKHNIIYILPASGGSSVVKHSSHYPKVKDSGPDNTGQRKWH